MNRIALTIVATLVLLGLGACGGSKKTEATPTPAPTSAPAVTPTPDPNAVVTPEALTDANSQPVSDGLCVAAIPNGWVDDGTGRGTTLSGARYVLFGGRIAGDAEWQRAVQLVKDQAAARPGAAVEEAATSIRVTFADDRGFEHRVRFSDRYCDITVTSAARPIPAGERAFWDAVVASLAPAS